MCDKKYMKRLKLVFELVSNAFLLQMNFKEIISLLCLLSRRKSLREKERRTRKRVM